MNISFQHTCSLTTPNVKWSFALNFSITFRALHAGPMVLCVTLGRQHVQHHYGLVGLHHRLVHHAGHPDRLVARLGQPVVLLVLRLFRQLDAPLFVQLRCSICCWDVTFINFSYFLFLCLLVL